MIITLNAYTMYLNPLVQLEPGRVTLRVLELEAKVPHLPQSDSSADEVEQLLAARLYIQAELELGVHRRHLYGKRFHWLLFLEHVGLLFLTCHTGAE